MKKILILLFAFCYFISNAQTPVGGSGIMKFSTLASLKASTVHTLTSHENSKEAYVLEDSSKYVLRGGHWYRQSPIYSATEPLGTDGILINTDAVWKNPNISVLTGNTVDFSYKNKKWSPIKGYLSLVDFGADNTGVLDASSAFNKAILYYDGNEIQVDSGLYVFNSQIISNTSGKGYFSGLKIKGAGLSKTIFDNRTGTALIKITSGGALGDRQINCNLTGFTITNTLNIANTVGIELEGVFNSKFENIKIEKQKSHGFFGYSTIGDITDNAQILIENCSIENNDGKGISFSAGANAVQNNIHIDKTRIIKNLGGGILLNSCINCSLKNSAIAYNEINGVVISSEAASPFSRTNLIENNEFDSNAGLQLQIERAVNSTILNNYFVANLGAGIPVVTKMIDVATGALNVFISKSYPRVTPTITGVTMFTIAPNVTNAQIYYTEWSSWQTAGNTKYNDLGDKTIIIDGNYYIKPVHSASNLILSDGVAPDFAARGQISLNSTSGTTSFAMYDSQSGLNAKEWTWRHGANYESNALSLLMFNDDRSQANPAIKFKRNQHTEVESIFPSGSVTIGSGTNQAVLDVQGTSSGVIIPRLTTTERDAISTNVNGMQIYNSTLGTYQFRENGTWKSRESVLTAMPQGSLTAAAATTAQTIPITNGAVPNTATDITHIELYYQVAGVGAKLRLIPSVDFTLTSIVGNDVNVTLGSAPAIGDVFYILIK